jgi:hypothetical protein
MIKLTMPFVSSRPVMETLGLYIVPLTICSAFVISVAKTTTIRMDKSRSSSRRNSRSNRNGSIRLASSNISNRNGIGALLQGR